MGHIADARGTLRKGRQNGHCGHEVGAVAHVQLHAMKGGGVHGDGILRHGHTRAHALQNAQHGAVALQGIRAQTFDPHGLKAQCASSQQIGGARPVAFNCVVARAVRAGMDCHAQAAGMRGLELAPCARRQHFPRGIGLGAVFHIKADAIVGQALQGQPHIGPGNGFLPAKRYGQRRRPHGGSQQQTRKILARNIHAQGHLSPAQRGVEALGVQHKRRAVGLAFKGDGKPQLFECVRQFGNGSFVHARRAVYAKFALASGQHGGK